MRAAYDGLEPLESCPTFEPDVMLLDIGLPKMNGYEDAEDEDPDRGVPAVPRPLFLQAA